MASTESATTGTRRQWRLADRPAQQLLIVVGLAFVLRLVWLLYARPQPVSDYQVYYRLAETLLDERFFGIGSSSAFWLPGYPWFLAGVMLISRSVVWLSLISVLLATLGCLLVYYVTVELTGRRSLALGAGVVYAVTPGLILYAPVLGTEQLFVVGFLGAVLMTLKLTSTSRFLALGVGVVAGFATLTRGEMLFYLPVVIGLVWLGSDLRNRSVKIQHSLLIIAGVLIVITPWIIRNMAVVDTGPSLSTVGGMNFYFGHRSDGYGFTEEVPWPPGDDRAADEIGWQEGLDYVRQRPIALLESARDGTYAWLESPEYALVWSSAQLDPDDFLAWEHRYIPLEGTLFRILILSSAISLSLAAAAFITWSRWNPRLRLFAAGTILMNWLGYAVLFFGHPRFRYTVDVIATILVTITIATLWNARARTSTAIGNSSTADETPA